MAALAALVCLAAPTMAAGGKAGKRHFPVSKNLCADPAFIRRVIARWNKNPHTLPNATILSLKFETVVRTDCVYEIRTRTDPDPATLIVVPKRGGDFFMSLGG